MSNNTQIKLIVDDKELTFKSKSDAIRQLHLKYNKTRSEIAKMLDIRYQMVRNILVNYENARIADQIRSKESN